jgi:hypothetical protein
VGQGEWGEELEVGDEFEFEGREGGGGVCGEAEGGCEGGAESWKELRRLHGGGGDGKGLRRQGVIWQYT